MSTVTVAIVSVVIVGGLVLLFVASTRRRDLKIVKEAAQQDAQKSNAGKEVEAAAKAENTLEEATSNVAVDEWVPPTEEAVGVSRRQFFNRSIVTLFALGLAGFGAACIGFLWPNKSTGFGGKIAAGKLSEILATIAETKTPFYVPEGRFYINPYPPSAIPKAKQVSSYAPVIPGMEEGIVALYQKCVHLGCRVPWCKSSQWFECPCHGSRYNRVGEKKGGPAPRGLDRFVVKVSGDNVTVDTGLIILGPPVGTNTTGQEAEGPHC